MREDRVNPWVPSLFPLPLKYSLHHPQYPQLRSTATHSVGGALLPPAKAPDGLPKFFFKPQVAFQNDFPNLLPNPNFFCFCLRPNLRARLARRYLPLVLTNNGTWFHPIFTTEPRNTLVSAKSFRLPARGSKRPPGGDQWSSTPLFTVVPRQMSDDKTTKGIIRLLVQDLLLPPLKII